MTLLCSSRANNGSWERIADKVCFAFDKWCPWFDTSATPHPLCSHGRKRRAILHRLRMPDGAVWRRCQGSQPDARPYPRRAEGMLDAPGAVSRKQRMPPV